MSINPQTLRVGDVISYRLMPKDLPTNPGKEWYGKVLSIHIDMPGWMDAALIESLEPAYMGLREFVLIQQIVEVRHSDEKRRLA